MDRQRYDGVRALVLGAGVSGEAAARLLLARGGAVALVDEGSEAQAAAAAARVREAGGEVRFGVSELPGGDFGFCVASPAFALTHPWIETCRRRDIPVISELELGARHWAGKVLAVTGSKGKSSAVKLCADVLNRAGVSASPAGNYGIPLCTLALDQPGLAWAIVEVSSFQMEHTWTFAPDIAVLLNIQADHFDRHADMAEYRALKWKLFSAMRPGGVALIPTDVEEAGGLPEGVRRLRFGVDPVADWRYVGHAVEGVFDGRLSRVSTADSWFDNPILGKAAAACVAALRYAGLGDGQVREGLSAFEPLAHRVQCIGESRSGVFFVDDSKATSLTATAAALQMVRKPVRLIAGGLLKENDLGSIKELLTQTTEKVYLIGHCSEEMCRAWADAVPCEVCGTLERAVDAAVRDAQSGETVLLSPGTASFDQFKSYRERGERFTARVRAVADLRTFLF